MTTQYNLTVDTSDLGTGDNWSNDLTVAVPGTTTLSSAVPLLTTENDLAYTLAGIPGADGSSGDFSADVVINSGSTNLTLDIFIGRVSALGILLSSSVGSDGGTQVCSAGTKTFNWTAPSRTAIQDIGSAGTFVVAPWTASGGGIVIPVLMNSYRQRRV